MTEGHICSSWLDGISDTLHIECSCGWTWNLSMWTKIGDHHITTEEAKQLRDEALATHKAEKGNSIMTKRKLQLVGCQHLVSPDRIPDRSTLLLTFTRELTPIEVLGLRAAMLEVVNGTQS